MSDRVVGIAVLNWRHGDAMGYLHFIAEYANGKRFTSWVPVVPQGLPEVEGQVCWTFAGDETDVLRVDPSMRITRTPDPEWHNTYHWTCRHVRMDDPEARRMGNWPEHVLRDLNPELYPMEAGRGVNHEDDDGA